MAQRIDVDTDELTSAGTQAQGVGATSPTAVPALVPPGADARSVQATTTVAAHGAKVLTYLTTAAGHAQNGGAQLKSDAVSFETADNHGASIIAGTGTGVTPAAPSAAPSVTTFVPDPSLSVPEGTSGAPSGTVDPEQFAALLHHGGDRGASLQQYAAYFTSAGTEAARRAAALRTVAAAIRGGGWTRDGAGAPAAAAFDRLAAWHDHAAEQCGSVSSAATTAYEDWSTTATGTPTPAVFARTRGQLEQANLANAASGGRYTPVVTQLQSQLATLRGQATTSSATYTATPAALFTPFEQPPRVVDDGGAGPDGSGETGDESGKPDKGKPATDKPHPGDGTETGSGSDAGDGATAANGTTNPTTGDPAQAATPGSTPTNAADDKTGKPGENSEAASTAASMAMALPSLLAGVVGAAVSLPAAAASQVGSTASQVAQGLAGAAQDFNPASDTTLDDTTGGDLGTGGDDPGLGGDTGLGGDSGAGGGGGGDVTTEPAGTTTLGTNAALAPPLTNVPTAGPTPTSASPTDGGRPMMVGGMPMMPMSGAGAGAAPPAADARSTTDNGKKAVLRTRPNTERIHAPVDRELAAQQHAASDASAAGAPLGRPRPKPTPRRGTGPTQGEETK